MANTISYSAGQKAMSKKLLALATMAALSSLASAAKAEEVLPILAPVTGIQHQDTHLVMLTDTEMERITAGHLSQPPASNANHSGFYWNWTWFPPGFHLDRGVHSGCGDVSCGVARTALRAAVGGGASLAGFSIGGPFGAAFGGSVSQILTSGL